MKPIIIGGNGPSFTKIDYQRLPNDFDIFRANNFYFEDHYWLTKKVTGYFVPHLEQLEIQFFNIFELNNRNEYHIEQIYCPLYHQTADLVNFPCVKFINLLKCGIKEIDELIAFYHYYHKKTPTTGSRMIVEAIIQGYTEIYLCGFDLYHGIEYPFEITKTVFDLHPDKEVFKKAFELGRGAVNSPHCSKYDALIIKMASEMKNITIYSISEESPINSFIPLAPIINTTPYIPTKKTVNYLNDWKKNPRVIKIEQENLEQEILKQENLEQKRLEQEKLEQEKHLQKALIQKLKQQFINKNMESEWDFLRQNMYLRLIYHAIKPLWILIKFTFKPNQKKQ